MGILLLHNMCAHPKRVKKKKKSKIIQTRALHDKYSSVECLSERHLFILAQPLI